MRFYNNGWEFTLEPFSQMRTQLIYGRNKFGRVFVPVRDLIPDESGNLPEGKFKVIQTREKGTTMIVPGQDDSHRYALFTVENGGFRGGIRIHSSSTVEVLRQCEAASACESGIATFCVLSYGEQLVFRSWGRNDNHMIVYKIDDDGFLSQLRMTMEAWEVLNEEVSLETAQTI